MLATVVTQSVNAAQVFALVATILFIIAFVIAAFFDKSIIWAIGFAGFVFVAVAIMFLA